MSEGNLIDAVCDRIKFDKDRLEKNELGRIVVESFNLTEFWTQFGAAVQALNNYVTKVGFSCGKKPYPTGGEMEAMMQDLLQYYNVMRDLYMVLPSDVGTVLYKAVTSAVVAIMSSLNDFIKSLHNLNEKGAKERLTLTATFWDACNAIDNLPKDNLQATLKVMESEVDLASDAQEELETVSTCAAIDKIRKDFQENDELNGISFKETEISNSNSNQHSDFVKSLANEPEISCEANKEMEGSQVNQLIIDDTVHSSTSALTDVNTDFRSGITDDNTKEVVISDTATVKASPLNQKQNDTNMENNVIRSDEKHDTHSKVRETKELSRPSEEESVGSKSKSEKLNSPTSSNHTNLSTNKGEAVAPVPQSGKEVFLRGEVPKLRLSGRLRRRRRRYLRDVSEDVLKSFESDPHRKNMEAVVLSVPQSFIDNCETFSTTNVIDRVCEHNPNLDTKEWVLNTHWVGEGKQLCVLILVDKQSAESIRALNYQIYISKELEIGVRKFVPITAGKTRSGNTMFTSNIDKSLKVETAKNETPTTGEKPVNSGNKTFTPYVRNSIKAKTKNKNKFTRSNPKKFNLSRKNQPFSRTIPSLNPFLKSYRPYCPEKTFAPDTMPFHHHEEQTGPVHEDNRSVRSDFHSQDYPYELPKKMRVSEQVNNNQLAKGISTPETRHMEQSDEAHVQDRSLSFPNSNNLTKVTKKGCLSRKRSSRWDSPKSHQYTSDLSQSNRYTSNLSRSPQYTNEPLRSNQHTSDTSIRHQSFDLLRSPQYVNESLRNHHHSSDLLRHHQSPDPSRSPQYPCEPSKSYLHSTKSSRRYQYTDEPSRRYQFSNPTRSSKYTDEPSRSHYTSEASRHHQSTDSRSPRYTNESSRTYYQTSEPSRSHHYTYKSSQSNVKDFYPPRRDFRN